MARYFKVPFADGGDKTAIPNLEQPDGSVSYTEGFGPDYELDPLVFPDAKDVPRNQTNELFYETTLALQQYQENGTPDFITTVDNDGDPFPYTKGARVRYDNGDGFKIYQSLVDDNESLPTDTTKWVWLDPDNQTSALILYDAVFEATVANNDVVYWNSINNEFTKAIADGTVAQNALGIADVTNARVFIAGLDSQFTGLTPSATYYLSDTVAGELVTTAPLNHIVHVGLAIEATEFVINIIPASATEGTVPAGVSLDFNGFTIPAGYLPEDGSAVSRTTYSRLFAALTSTQSGEITNTEFEIKNLTSTDNFRIGMAVEGSGIPVGALIASVDSSTQVTLTAAATSTITTSATFFLHGNADGSTTFNVPDSRRRTTVGAGGLGTAVLGNTVGAVGGEEQHVLSAAELASHTHGVSDPEHRHLPQDPAGSFLELVPAGGSNTIDFGGSQPVNEIGFTATSPTDITIDSEGDSEAFNIMQPSLVVTRIIKY